MKHENRVLIVDDDATNLTYVSEILEKESYRIETADSGEKGLEIAERFKPDLVLLDVAMPGIDGYEVCRRLRSHRELSHTKILFLSAKVHMNEKLKGYKVGGDDYITKPFDDNEVKAKIRVFLRLQYEENKQRSEETVPDDKLLSVFYKLKQDINNIVYVKSDSPYCRIFSNSIKNEPYRLRATIQVIEDFFKGKDLIRVHRSYLINPKKILSVNKQKNNEYKLLMKDSEGRIAMVPVGRSYHGRLKAALPHLFTI